MKKLLGGIATFVALVIAMTIGKGLGRAAVETATSPDIDKGLMEVASKINSSLPMMVDKDTRLDTTVGGPGKKFTYFYTLTAYASTDVNANAVHDALAPVVKGNVCGSTAMKPMFKMGVTAHYVYRGNDGVEIARLSLSPADCGVSP